jgi:outer membrane protein assembly factor BamB
MLSLGDIAMKIAARIRAGLLAAAFVCVSGGVLASDDATVFMINPAHDGNIKLKHFSARLKLAWSRMLNAQVSYPVIANDKVYVTTASIGNGNYGTTLYALDLHTGDVLWTQPIPGTYYISSAVYDNGQIFVLNFDGLLRAFDSETGTPGLSVHLGSEYADQEPPIADRGTIYASEQAVYAIDEATGAQKWAQGYSWGGPPALGGGNVFTTNGGWLYSTSAKKGQTKWHQTGVDGLTAFYHGRVYATNGAVVDAKTGDAVSVALPASDFPLAFWTHNGTDYRIALQNGTLSSIDVNTGETAWTFSGDADFVTSPIVINDRVVVGSSANTLFVVDAETGTKRWSGTVPAGITPTGSYCCSGPWVSMAAGDGALVVPGGSSLTAFVPAKN